MTAAVSPLRLCLILHSTRSDNLGVGALSVAEVDILREVAARLGRPLQLTILDWKDRRAPYVTGDDIEVVDLDTRFLINPKGFFATVRRADAVIDIGAGDSFADLYGAGRLNRMFVMKYLTHLAGTPLVVAPQTIGPFEKPLSRWLARFSLNRAALVATRDAMSTKAARALGMRGAVIEASDVALRLPYEAPQPTAAVVKIGLNVSGLLMAGGYTGKNEFGLQMDYPGLIRSLIGHFLTHHPEAELHLVPHVFPDRPVAGQENDYSASEALCAEFPALKLAPRFASPSEAKSYIAGMDFFAGARMHACIAAFSSGVPVAPMAYSRKFAGLFGSIGYPYTVDCTALSAAEAEAEILALFERRAGLRAEAATALAEGRRKLALYEDGLEALLRGLR